VLARDGEPQALKDGDPLGEGVTEALPEGRLDGVPQADAEGEGDARELPVGHDVALEEREGEPVTDGVALAAREAEPLSEAEAQPLPEGLTLRERVDVGEPLALTLVGPLREALLEREGALEAEEDAEARAETLARELALLLAVVEALMVKGLVAADSVEVVVREEEPLDVLVAAPDWVAGAVADRVPLPQVEAEPRGVGVPAPVVGEAGGDGVGVPEALPERGGEGEPRALPLPAAEPLRDCDAHALALPHSVAALVADLLGARVASPVGAPVADPPAPLALPVKEAPPDAEAAEGEADAVEDVDAVPQALAGGDAEPRAEALA